MSTAWSPQPLNSQQLARLPREGEERGGPYPGDVPSAVCCRTGEGIPGTDRPGSVTLHRGTGTRTRVERQPLHTVCEAEFEQDETLAFVTLLFFYVFN